MLPVLLCWALQLPVGMHVLRAKVVRQSLGAVLMVLHPLLHGLALIRGGIDQRISLAAMPASHSSGSSFISRISECTACRAPLCHGRPPDGQL